MYSSPKIVNNWIFFFTVDLEKVESDIFTQYPLTPIWSIASTATYDKFSSQSFSISFYTEFWILAPDSYLVKYEEKMSPISPTFCSQKRRDKKFFLVSHSCKTIISL